MIINKTDKDIESKNGKIAFVLFGSVLLAHDER